MHTVDDAASENSGVATSRARPSPTGPRQEKKIVLLLCLLAATHAFIFSTAFPFFNNVDEQFHFDLVLRYAHGQVPRRMETLSPEAARYITLLTSSYYLGDPEKSPAGQMPPPLWTRPPDLARQIFMINQAAWETCTNYEVTEPPLYYALAGGWWDLGRTIFDNGPLLYWLRFFNLLLIVALVWLAYATARLIFPEHPFIRLAVPALMAFLPQTAFYSLGNDLLAALSFGLVFYWLVKWVSLDHPSPRLGLATGLAFAAAYLSKTTAVPLLVIAAAAVLWKTWKLWQRGKARAALPPFAVFLGCAVPPILAWMIWCRVHYGDLTGSKLKMENLGWTLKPFAQWWHHPLFTGSGLWTFLSGQLGTLWQGEFCWLNRPMALPHANSLYAFFSLVFLTAAICAFLRPGSHAAPLQRQALSLAFACFFAVLAFFALLSLVYDFGNCAYPSRLFPFFISGRLLLGALIPFLLLIVYGFDRLLNIFGGRIKCAIFVAALLLLLAVELVTDWPAFSNPYNWYHLP
jgi:hypothetical protein